MHDYVIIALIIIGALLFYELLKEAVHYFFKKTVDNSYITEEVCKGNRKSCSIANKQIEYNEDLKAFKKEMREGMGMMKGILLVIATKQEIPIEELKELMK